VYLNGLIQLRVDRMLQKEKVNYLIVGQTPPPHHGQAVVTGMLVEHRWTKVKVRFLRMAYSDVIDHVGRFSLGKIVHLFSLVLQTWTIVFTQRPKILYYLPASANRTPVLRDIVYLLAVKWCFKKTIYHFHAGGLPSYLDSMPFLGRIARLAYGTPTAAIDVIETNPPTGEYFHARKNVVVNNGVGVNLVERVRPSDAQFEVIYVGVLNEGKGVKEIIETARLLKLQNVDCGFVLVGDWSSERFKGEVLELIDLYELGAMLRFTGPLSGNDKWQAYADADCMFFPSHYEAETFGMVLVEAMAYSLPLVTTRWRGIPKVLGDSACGYLCDVKAPEQYAEKLELLMQDPDLRDAMGENGRTRYEDEFTKEKFLERMESVFEELVRD
jgi:glycosyltransferase involved in cell wall biosynthesis